MKIGLVCPYNIFISGGVQECVMALQKQLEVRGHEAKIITPQPRGYRAAPPEHIIFVGGAAAVRSLHTTAQVSASVDIEALDNLLEREQFDVLHFHEPWVPIIARQILGRSRAVNVATFHAKLPDTVLSRTIERVITPYTSSLLKKLDALTAVSEAAAAYVQSLTRKPVSIVPNGIDLKKYRQSDRRQPQKSTHMRSILYVGRLEKRKGVKYLIEAFELLAETNPDLHLIIAGDGPDYYKLQQHVENKDIPRITFLGFVDEAMKLRLLKQADLFCSPALYGESFGIVLLEAMATGLVTVAGNNPGYAGVMTGHGQLSLVNPKDAVEFARRMQLLLNDDVLQKLWQKWAKAEVAKYTYNDITDQYVRVYKQAIKVAK